MKTIMLALSVLLLVLLCQVNKTHSAVIQFHCLYYLLNVYVTLHIVCCSRYDRMENATIT